MSNSFDPKSAFNPAYIGARMDLINLIPQETRELLDVGCATGELGRTLKSIRSAVRVTGVERDARMCEVARGNLDLVINGDIEEFSQIRDLLDRPRYDCIICGDILEHLADPWLTLREISMLLTDDGTVIVSLPNVSHIDTLINLVIFKRWPYRGRGVHDSSHQRWFALKNVRSLVHQASLEIVSLKRNYRFIDRPSKINEAARFVAAPGIRDILAYQYVVACRKSSGTTGKPDRASLPG